MSSCQFISNEERQTFDLRNRVIPRSVKDINNDKPILLSKFVSKHLVNLLKSDIKWFGSVCISVKKDDGMSWSAQTVYDLFKNEYERFVKHSWCITDRSAIGGVPTIAEYIGRKTFFKLALSCGLAESFKTLGARFKALIISLSVIISMLYMFFEQVAALQHAPNLMLLRDWRFYFFSAALSTVSLIINSLKDNHLVSSKSNSVNEFLNTFHTDIDIKVKKNIKYANFVDKLAQKLASIKFPRVVIIDNYDDIDPTTKQVIYRYFQKYAKNANGTEYWVIFESDNHKQFSKTAVICQYTSIFSKTILCEQLTLTSEEKDRLAEYINNPERKYFYTVKSICCGIGDDNEYYVKRFREYRDEHRLINRHYDMLNFLYFLSMTSIPGNHHFNESTLISKLSKQNLLRSLILKEFLYGTRFAPHEFRSNIATLRKSFSDILSLQGKGFEATFRVCPEAYYTLNKHEDLLDLSSSELGHLYWCFFWYDSSPKPPDQFYDLFYVRKTTHHIINCNQLAIKNNNAYNKIVEKMYAVYLYVIDGSVKLCLFDDIINILDKTSYLLIDQVFDGIPNAHKQLLKRYWEVYALLGDDKILVLITTVLAQTQVISPVSNGDSKHCYDLVQITEDIRSQLNSISLLSHYEDEDTYESIADYLKVRSLCLSSLLQPLADKCLDFAQLFYGISDPIISIEEIFQKATSRMNNSIDEIHAIEFLAISMSLWCYSIVLPDRLLINIILNSISNNDAVIAEIKSKIECDNMLQYVVEQIYEWIFTSNIIQLNMINNDSTNISSDLLSNSFTRLLCVLSLYFTIAVYNILHRHHDVNSSELDDIYNDDVCIIINEIIDLCNSTTGTNLVPISKPQELGSNRLIDEVDRLMQLSELIWMRFGIHNLCGYMRLLRFNFTASCKKTSNYNALPPRDIFDIIRPTLEQIDYISMMANLSVAHNVRAERELSSPYMRNAALIAIKGDFGKHIKNELSLLYIMFCNAVDNDTCIMLEQLIANDNEYIRSYLLSVKVDNIIGKLLSILNVSERIKYNELIGRLQTTIEEVIQQIEDDSVKNEANAMLDLFEIKRDLRKGQIIDEPETVLNNHLLTKASLYSSVEKLPLFQLKMFQLFVNSFHPFSGFFQSVRVTVHVDNISFMC